MGIGRVVVICVLGGIFLYMHCTWNCRVVFIGSFIVTSLLLRVSVSAGVTWSQTLSIYRCFSECSHDTYTWYFRLSWPFRQPLWIWNAPGIGFSPLGQLGVPVEGAVPRQTAGARLGTVHWGGAGGSGYMLTLGAKRGWSECCGRHGRGVCFICMLGRGLCCGWNEDSGIWCTIFFVCINKTSNSTMTSHARPFSPRDWEHHLVVLTYTGCVFDTSTQKAEGIEWI